MPVSRSTLGGFCRIFICSFFLPKATAAAKIVALESQLSQCLENRQSKRIGRFSDSFRFLWVILSKVLDDWKRFCHEMKPRTVVGWKEKGFKLYWKATSMSSAWRNPISPEIRNLIRQISLENAIWGAPKIRDASTINPIYWIVWKLTFASRIGEARPKGARRLSSFQTGREDHINPSKVRFFM